VAPIEAKFRKVLLERLGAEAQGLPELSDRAQWPRAHEQLSALFATRTRAQWCALLEGSDACFAPVLAPLEAPQHAQHVARGAFVEIDGITQPAPSPRFSATPARTPKPPQRDGAAASEWAQAWGVPTDVLSAGAMLQEQEPA
jgi:alpha-methylacyl-CoA racemase